MVRASIDETYLSAFNAAIMQREQIFEEFERLKNRRILVEAAARALEPVVYPDEYLKDRSEQASSPVVELPRPTPNVEIWNPTAPVEPGPVVPVVENIEKTAPVQAVTQVYVRGDGEPDEEIQRRISIAIGRSAAD
jgi:hypothetical protein